MTGNWDPKKTWNRIHGDGKSTTGGKFHMKTMHDSKGKYQVKLVEGDKTIYTKVYDEEPTFGTIVTDLRNDYNVEK